MWRAEAGWPVGRLLRTFSWQEWRHHGPRHATAVLAVLLGVALAFSVHLINQSALGEFSAAVRAVSGQADVSLRAAHGTLDETWYARVARHPGVAVASPVVDVPTQASRLDGDRTGPAHALRIVGLDPLVAAPVAPGLLPRLDAERPDHDRLALFAPDTVSLNPSAQALLGARPGDVLSVQAGLRVHRLRVIGTVAAGGEPVGVMDIAGAQALFGLTGRLTRLDLQWAAGARADSVIDELHLPEGVQADAAQDEAQRVSGLSRAYRVNLTVLALVALFTGAFLVFSILSLSVAKRQQQFALLGVLGLGAGERLQLVLLESAAVGVLGSLLGLALGTGLAALALRLLAGDLGGGYFPGIAPTLHWSGAAALVYGGLGVGAAVLGGLMPARMAQRLAPAQALKGLGGPPSRGWGGWAGVGLLIASIVLARLPPVGGVPLWAYIAVACLLVGGIACVPATVGLLLGLWPPSSLARSATLMLAVERARRMRHSATVVMAGVVASLSLSVALTVMVASFRGSVDQWLDVLLPADLYARAASSATAGAPDSAAFTPALREGIARLPGVRRIAGLRLGSVSLARDRADVALIARPLDSDAAGLPRALPTIGPVRPPDPGRPNVFVSEAVADLYGIHPGHVTSLPLRAGQPPTAVFVRGLWRDYARQQGAIVIALADYQRLTGDPSVNDLALWLTPTARTGDVQRAMRALAQSQGFDGRLIEFAEPREIRATTLRIFDRSFAVTYWLQAVAIGIGLFGTAASFSAQVLARRKEFGLLGHLGFTRRQVLAIVAGEGAALSSVGALLGLALGLGISLVLVHVVNPQSFHWTMDMLLPWPRLAALCASVVAAGTATAWVAGRTAAGRDAVMAVKEDW